MSVRSKFTWLKGSSEGAITTGMAGRFVVLSTLDATLANAAASVGSKNEPQTSAAIRYLNKDRVISVLFF